MSDTPDPVMLDEADQVYDPQAVEYADPVDYTNIDVQPVDANNVLVTLNNPDTGSGRTIRCHPDCIDQAVTSLKDNTALRG